MKISGVKSLSRPEEVRSEESGRVGLTHSEL